MEKFSTALAGYKKEEVNKFVSDVITQVEAMISDLKNKDEEIDNLKKDILKYQNMEESLNKALLMAEESSNKSKSITTEEEAKIIEKARMNASRIVNEALLEAEKAQKDAMQLKRNIITFKSRLKIILESQLDLVEEIDHLDL